ncbi:MAG: hypothetical protein CR981_04760 [Proteobacteria bacterium]|nr:MAG: hypothetical protein CR981_04760 [Pseudomonadota bacterium]PIE65296.1 MAG: hypothetical protein CSA26_04300 [Desulfobacterales bacterium]
MDNSHLPQYIQDLLFPSVFDYQVEKTELIQTHISYVILAGEFVYKFKKPVDFGFLDFSSLEKRRYFCEQELLLNRRLCPDLYLEMVSVTKERDGHRLNGAGTVIEYGVKMVRMDEKAMMAQVIGRGELTSVHLDRIIDRLVPFYQDAAGGETFNDYGTSKVVAVNVLENFDQTETFIGQSGLSNERFEIIRDYARSFLAKEAVFNARINDGKIRDCHGDLYSANICLDDRVHIFDCIEFNERFRYSDVAADVGFLAMDLDYHGLDELSDYFLRQFAEASADPGLLGVADFYKCYRAYVRGKIGLFTASDPAVDRDTARNCRKQAERYFDLAERYVRKV